MAQRACEPIRRRERPVGERPQIGGTTTQWNEIGSREAQCLLGPSACPQLTADRAGVHTVVGDPGGHHARTHRVLGHHLRHGGEVTHQGYAITVGRT